MATDNAMSRFLCEKVLGWEEVYQPHDGSDVFIEWRLPGAADYSRLTPTPDFHTWEGFGLLLTALTKLRHVRALVYGEVLPWQWTVYVHCGNLDDVQVVIDPNLPRALMLAAAKAYGYEEGA